MDDLKFQKSYERFLRQWYLSSKDPDVIQWRDYMNPITNVPNPVHFGSSGSIECSSRKFSETANKVYVDTNESNEIFYFEGKFLGVEYIEDNTNCKTRSYSRWSHE